MMLVHTPSRRQSIIFFLISLALAGFVLLWTFYLNKGTVRFSGQNPYSVHVSTKNILCDKSECAIKLTPRNYSIRITKDGYYDNIKEVQVVRGRTTRVSVEFDFIPVLSEVGQLVLPINEAPLRPPFLGTDKLENFPRNPRRVEFSPFADKALVSLGRELYMYDVADHSVEKINLPVDTFAVWAGDKLAYLENNDGKQFLKLWNDGNSQNIAGFERPFTDPSIASSPDGKNIFISNGAGAGGTYYLVNTENFSRKRYDFGKNTAAIKWGRTKLFLQQEEAGRQKFFIVDLSSGDKKEIEAKDIENIIEVEDGTFIFVADVRLDSNGIAEKDVYSGVSFSQVLEDIENATTDTETSNDRVFLTQYDAGTGTYKTLAEIQLENQTGISKLTFDSVGEKLYFVKSSAGENLRPRLFEIRLKP